MEKITLNDILKLSDNQLKNTKIRFMLANEAHNFDPVSDAKDPAKQDKLNLTDLVFNSQNKRNFKQGMIAIGFIPIGEDHWLMTGIVRILNDNGYNQAASAEYLEKKYNFRLVIHYHKADRPGVRKALGFIDNLEVIEIWNPEKSINDKNFPGYKDVCIGYEELKIKLEISDAWRTALQSRKGVYLISDKNTGRLYVGSAYGVNGILGRWQTYLKSGYDKNEKENGKYVNEEFKKIVTEKGLSYIKDNFQYSILETFTDDVPDEYIIGRESWWKEALLSRKKYGGYNCN